LLRTTAVDGTYSVVFRPYVVGGGYLHEYTISGLQVLNGKIVFGTIVFPPYTYTVHNNSDITCNGTTYTNQTPTVLLGDLHGCLNSVVAGYASYFNFFTPSANLVFRALPAANNAQLTNQIRCVRNILDQQNLSVVWGEYAIPSLLSVGPNYRFGVSILKSHDAVTGEITGETYGIMNYQSTSLSRPSVRQAFLNSHTSKFSRF
jgi:hypothetical protein